MRQGVFAGLLSAGFSLGLNFAEFQKMRAEGVLAKFAIARLYGYFGSRGLLPLVATLQNFRKCALRVSLPNFDIARLYGHFGSRGLLQNLVLSWLFKCILIRR